MENRIIIPTKRPNEPIIHIRDIAKERPIESKWGISRPFLDQWGGTQISASWHSVRFPVYHSELMPHDRNVKNLGLIQVLQGNGVIQLGARAHQVTTGDAFHVLPGQNPEIRPGPGGLTFMALQKPIQPRLNRVFNRMTGELQLVKAAEQPELQLEATGMEKNYTPNPGIGGTIGSMHWTQLFQWFPKHTHPGSGRILYVPHREEGGGMHPGEAEIDGHPLPLNNGSILIFSDGVLHTVGPKGISREHKKQESEHPFDLNFYSFWPFAINPQGKKKKHDTFGSEKFWQVENEDEARSLEKKYKKTA